MWSENYYRSQLSAFEQSLYDSILTAWRKFQSTVHITYRHMNQPDFASVVDALMLDHPEVFWVDTFSGYQIQTVNVLFGIEITLEFHFFYSVPAILELQNKMAAWRNRVVSQVPLNADDTEKLWMLFDYMARRITYGERVMTQSHTITGCFMDDRHMAVCQGIAMGMKYLVESCSIPCIVVNGSVKDNYGMIERHNWNVFSIRGQFRHLDATAELSIAKAMGRAREKQVAMTDEEAQRAGYFWDTKMVPACVRSNAFH